MQQPDVKVVVVVSTRKRNRSVEHDKRRDKEGSVTKYFREKYDYNGPIRLKAMGKKLWSKYQNLRNYYNRHGTLDNFEEK